MTRAAPGLPLAQWRRRLGVGLVAALLGGVGLLVPAGPTAAAAEPKEPATAVFGNCLTQQRAGDLVLLIDESDSLHDTDADGDRVTAAQDLVVQLAATTAQAGIALDVAVAGFASTYESTLGWTALGKGGADQVLADLERYRDRKQGIQTDYWMGLNGARESLAARGADRCQAIVWFSDGEFFVQLNTGGWRDHPEARDKPYAPGRDLRDEGQAKAARDDAEKAMCKPGGLADQLRRSRITVFAVGLEREEGKVDFATMQGVATGSKVDGRACGRRSDPTPGSFTRARDIADLLFAFRSIAHPGTETTSGLCPREQPRQCAGYGHRFVLDRSLTAVHVDAKASEAGAKAFLQAPNGRWLTLEVGRHSADEGNAVYTWDAQQGLLSLDLSDPKGTETVWRGPWTLVFAKQGAKRDETSVANIDVSGNLFPAAPAGGALALESGRTHDLLLRLTDDRGTAVASSRLEGSGTLSAQLVGVRVGDKPIAAQRIPARDVDRTPFTVDLSDAAAGPAILTLRLDITTAPFGSVPGTALTPRVVRVPVSIVPPAGVGGPRPARVDFGTITGVADTDATVTVVGPACVWRDPSSAAQVEDGADAAGAVTISSTATDAASCLVVPEGQQQPLTLHLRTERAGNGGLAGTVAVNVAPLDQRDRVTPVQVEFRANLARPLNRLDFVLALIAALVLGLGIPWALLALAKYLTARIPGQALMVQDLRVRLAGSEVLRDGAPLALRDTDFAAMVPLKTKGSRRTTAAGLGLSTHTGWSPFGPGYVLVDSQGRPALTSETPQPYGRNRAARLPLAVHNTWVAVRTPDGPPEELQLVLFADLGSGDEGRRRLVEDVRQRLPGLAGRLGDETGGAETGAGGPGAGGPGAGGPGAGPPAPPPPGTSAAAPAERETFSFDFDDESGGR